MRTSAKHEKHTKSEINSHLNLNLNIACVLCAIVAAFMLDVGQQHKNNKAALAGTMVC